MKIKEGFMLREVAGSYVVVPVGQASIDFNGMMNLNETGAFLFQKLLEGCTEDELVEAMTAEYEVDEALARSDIKIFVERISEEGLLEA